MGLIFRKVLKEKPSTRERIGLTSHNRDQDHCLLQEMANEIISYIEMCQREAASLQRGMNFGIGGTHSVILMSLRANAPYNDRIEADGTVLIYEGHDEPRTARTREPKAVDQPRTTEKGRLTQNGQFEAAALGYKAGKRSPERVRVYEKIHSGIWSYNGMFHLLDAWTEQNGTRLVFKFRLEAVEGEEDLQDPVPSRPERRRIIPAAVKLEVWRRDAARCVLCGATDELHFRSRPAFFIGGHIDNGGKRPVTMRAPQPLQRRQDSLTWNAYVGPALPD